MPHANSTVTYCRRQASRRLSCILRSYRGRLTLQTPWFSVRHTEEARHGAAIQPAAFAATKLALRRPMLEAAEQGADRPGRAGALGLAQHGSRRCRIRGASDQAAGVSSPAPALAVFGRTPEPIRHGDRRARIVPGSGVGSASPKCLKCGSRMRRATRSAAGILEIVLVLVLVVAGVCAFCLLPGFGFLIGPVLCVASLVYLGARRRRVWRCERCGEYFDPTVSSSTTRRGR
jgi:hypothetical protein